MAASIPKTPLVVLTLHEFQEIGDGNMVALLTQKLYAKGVRDVTSTSDSGATVTFWSVGPTWCGNPIVAPSSPEAVCISAIEDLVRVLIDGETRRLVWNKKLRAFFTESEEKRKPQVGAMNNPQIPDCVSVKRNPRENVFSVGVQGDEETRRITGHLVVAGVIFGVMPQPNEVYEITVSLEHESLLFNLLKLKEQPAATRNLSLSEIMQLYTQWQLSGVNIAVFANQKGLSHRQISKAIYIGRAMDSEVEVPHDFEC